MDIDLAGPGQQVQLHVGVSQAIEVHRLKTLRGGREVVSLGQTSASTGGEGGGPSQIITQGSAFASNLLLHLLGSTPVCTCVLTRV